MKLAFRFPLFKIQNGFEATVGLNGWNSAQLFYFCYVEDQDACWASIASANSARRKMFSSFPQYAQTSSANYPPSCALDTEVVTGGTVGLSQISIVQVRNEWSWTLPVHIHGVDSDKFTFT